MRRRRVEGDGTARLELVLLETDAHPQRPARDVAVLLAAVRHQRCLRTRFGPDRIRDVQELDVTVAVRSQPLPTDARVEVDDTPRLRALRQAVVIVQPPGGLGRT